MTNRFFTRVSRVEVSLITLLFAAYLILPPMAHAQFTLEIDCGDTVGPGGSFTATDNDGDMDDCDEEGDPALTVVGPVTLNLGTIEIYNDDGPAILIEGRTARITGGHVTGSDNDVGVIVAGSGGHRLVGMEVEGAYDDGIEVNSGRTTLVNNNIHDNYDDGIESNGNFNSFHSNTSTDNGGDGLDDNDGGNSLWIDNVAEDNGDNGFEIDTSNNRFFRNRAIDNGDDGFDQDDSDDTGNIFVGNTATDNDSDGFEFEGDRNLVVGNVSNDNDDGFEVFGGSNQNRFLRNRATGNSDFDAVDNNTNCDANIWRGNVFGTRDPATCIF